MRFGSKSRLASLVILSGLCLSAYAAAADWPTYLHDNARSGATDEQLAAPLVLQWTRPALHPPELAWSETRGAPDGVHPMTPRVNFDTAFHAAIVGDSLFLGGSDGKLCCLNALTGEERWHFFTAGPIRLAPAVWNEKVYFGSDDGCVYCLKAADGALVWKRYVAPTDERVIGSGHVISRWPVRTGVLVDGGVAYFGAGVFPHETVYLAAANAENGNILWVNDARSQLNAGRDEFTPQGYLLANKTNLFVPSGRSMPAAFSRDKGDFIYQRQYAWRDAAMGGILGGTYALLADDQMFTGASHLLVLKQDDGAAGLGWYPAHRMAVTAGKAYMASGSKITAVNRKGYGPAAVEEAKVRATDPSVNAAAKKKKAAKKAAKAGAKAAKEAPQPSTEDTGAKAKVDEAKKKVAALKQSATLWQTPSDCDCALIAAANLVVAGGDGVVVALDAATGAKAWNATVDGKAYGLAAANGRLYVSTDKGTLYCFASADAPGKAASPIQIAPKKNEAPFPKDDLTPVYEAAADTILKQTGAAKGFCLVLGAEQGRLAYEIAKRTQMQVCGIESDAAKVEAARRAIDATGLYGSRIVFEQGDPTSLPYSNYFANVIVSDGLLLTGQVPGVAAEVAKRLKPCGGVIILGAPKSAPAAGKGLSPGALKQWIAGMGLGDARVEENEAGVWASLTRGALPNAGSWTHQYANPGNTASSDDQLVRGALGVLWYGDPGPTLMADRHAGAPAPLALNGRLFVQGTGYLMAYDAYNGVELWRRENKDAIRLNQKKVEGGNLAASQDSIFVAKGGECSRIAQADGETLATYTVSAANDGKTGTWGWVAYVDGRLYGSAGPNPKAGQSESLFAFDVKTGKPLWRYEGKNIGELTIAIGGGRVFFVDSSLSPEQRDAMLREDKTALKALTGEAARKAEGAQKEKDARMAVALDAATGQKAWEKPVDVTYCSNYASASGNLIGMVHDGVYVLGGANANGHYWKEFLEGNFSQRRLVALSAQDGSVMWAKDANYRIRPLIVGQTVVAEPWGYDLRTGAQKTRVNPVTGADSPWVMMRPGHHCGTISGCPNMLFFRSAAAGYYDLADDSGVRHFGGLRLGCWINAVPANGLALMPEAAAGCTCLFSIVGTVTLEPRQTAPAWSIYGNSASLLPVKRLAINLGGPGDRRDAKGDMWFGYKRPSTPKTEPITLRFNLKEQPANCFFSRNEKSLKVEGTDAPWLFASGARGLKSCAVPLTNASDKPVPYTVRLYFADLDNTQPGQRVFDVKLQGKTILENFDIIKEAGGPGKALIREVKDLPVQGDLTVELAGKTPDPGPNQQPLLNAIEVVREDKAVAKAL